MWIRIENADCFCTSKKLYDKRNSMKERDVQREIARTLKERR